MEQRTNILSLKHVNGLAGIALALLLACNIYAEQNWIVGIMPKMMFTTGFIVLWTAFLYLNVKNTPHWVKRRKIYFLGLLLYYIWLLLHVLFFDVGFGRDQLHYGINLKPFFTIKNYLRAYSHGNFPRNLMLINLVGNLAAFAPMGVFLPALFDRERKFFIYIATLSISIGVVEWIQFKTNTGSCDIDDFILNLCGGLIVWIIVMIPPIKRIVCGCIAAKGRK